ncbi:MAG: alpha/beta hydrolase [Pseudomonadota bacterium]
MLQNNAPSIQRLSAAKEFIFLERSATEIAYAKWGSGPPIACLHATGHGSGDFIPLAKKLASDFTIFALDWPGQGLSPDDGFAPEARHYADLIDEFISLLKIPAPILLGNSIGGAAAIIAVSRDDNKFRGLVICNAGGLASIDLAARIVIRAMARFFELGAKGAWWYETSFSFYYKYLVLPGARDRAEEIVTAGKDLASLLAKTWAGFARDEADIRSAVPSIRTPVWAAWAKSDRLVSWSRSSTTVALFPNHTVDLFAGGHSPFLESTNTFAAGLHYFASSLNSNEST